METQIFSFARAFTQGPALPRSADGGVMEVGPPGKGMQLNA